MPEITGVLLNWKRANNVRHILAAWQAGGMIREAIVWNNNHRAAFEHDWAKVITANEDLGLYTRFAAMCLARHECVLIQDDDVALPTESLEQLYDGWEADPDVLHGVFGRRPRSDGSYGKGIQGDDEAPVVLTRALLARRQYGAEFFTHARQFDHIQGDSQPYGNGEDIIFSYCVMLASGRPNRVHRVAVNELPARDAIHGRNWQAHVAHRTRLMRACQAWLEESNHETRRDLHYV